PLAGRDAWRGVATGTGVARGRARLLRHPDEGGRLLPGEILVAPSTDPGWTPLFLKAGGLVVETGGYLSHGAIVAREFALPAVVNLPGILTVLRDGDEVEVDGLSGTVRRVGG
ncbi:PEP-utilizing enzyme, partial [Zoogloea oryzae]|uniref:PEP-utilizing enzyme n=1 Tax=Zoogloea oryzae TaxID=310767 RepID=UPI0024E0C6F7